MGNHLSRMSVGFLHISCSVKILVSNLVFLIYFVAVVLYAWMLLLLLQVGDCVSYPQQFYPYFKA